MTNWYSSSHWECHLYRRKLWKHSLGLKSPHWQSVGEVTKLCSSLTSWTCTDMWPCVDMYLGAQAWHCGHIYLGGQTWVWQNIALSMSDHICASMNWRTYGVWRSINRSLSCPAPCVHMRTHLGNTSLHDIEQCCNRVNQKGPFWNLLFHAQINCKLRAMTASFIKPPRKSQSKVRRALNCKARQMTSSLFLILLGTYWALAAMLKMCGQTSICKETNK